MSKLIPVDNLKARKFVSAKLKGIKLSWKKTTNTYQIVKDGDIVADNLSDNKFYDTIPVAQDGASADYIVYQAVPGSGSPEGSTITAIAPSPTGVIGSDYVFATAQSTSTPAFKGMRSTFDVLNLGRGAYDKTVWFSFSICASDQSPSYGGLINWVQMGYMTIGSSTFPIIQVWSYSGVSGEISVPTTVLGTEVPFSAKRAHRDTFSIYNVGGNLWRTKRGDGEILEMDLGGPFGIRPQIAIESSPVSKLPSFPTIDFNPAMEVLLNDVWTPVSTGQSQRITIINGKQWGMQGNIQNGALADNQVLMGSGVPPLPGYVSGGFPVTLWS